MCGQVLPATHARCRKRSNPADRIAANWYSSGSFTIDLAFHDSNTHQVAVYLVDWDTNGAPKGWT